MEKFGFGNNIEKEQPKNFRDFIEPLIKNSDLFPKIILSGETKESTIIDALENKKFSLYHQANLRGYKSIDNIVEDAEACLLTIYNELESEKPDNDYIKMTLTKLKEYLHFKNPVLPN